MSSMNFMEKLLDGVECQWKALGAVTTIKTGPSVNKQIISANPGEYPVINSGREPLGFINEWNTDNDPIGVTTRGAGVGSITWQEGKYFRGNLNYSVTINGSLKISIRYLYHLLLEMQSDIQALCTYDGIPALNAGNLKELQIPIPCPENPEKSLEIQAEIARILDAFAELTAELTAELNSRKKQYNYYRDQLLSFEEGEIEWKTLGELAALITKGTTPKSYEQSGISFVKTEAFDGTRINKKKLSYIDKITHQMELKRSMLEADDILFTIAGATIGKIAIVNEDILPANTNQALAIIRLGQTVNKKYIFYILTSNRMKQYIEKNSKGSAQPNLNLEQINSFIVPIPTIAEQAHIVAILDKFDALTNSITEGLPREIELRQKQYEYYRDLLLSFPKHEGIPA